MINREKREQKTKNWLKPNGDGTQKRRIIEDSGNRILTG
jgi:hypothetical protein